jgi:cellulose synthase/poly-beta-1,6-N-acetylglucosamine synthase-like glycosyltransferase
VEQHRKFMPTVSIVIPYHKAHATVCLQAVASCLYQSVQDFEVVLVNDSELPNYTFQDNRIRTVNSYGLKLGKNRAAVARNYGTQHAVGEYVVYLDGDDYLLPAGLEVLLRAHINHDKTYTYSSHYNGQFHMRPPDYNQKTYESFNIHPITCLLPKNAVMTVGGFDEDAPGWEDWTLYLRLAISGYCGEYHRGPIFVYRDEFSINHIQDVAGGTELMERVIKPYKQNGAITMAACCGGVDKSAARRVITGLPQIEPVEDGMIMLEYVGDMQGTSTWRHPLSHRVYRAGRNPANRYLRVPAEDVAWLEQFKFKRAMPEQQFVPAPAPAEVLTIAQDIAPVEVLTIAQDELSDIDDVVQVKRGRPKKN